MNRFLRIIFLLMCMATCHAICAHQQYVKPQWYVGKSDFREAVLDSDGKLTDSYNRMNCDTVNVFDLNTQGEYSLNVMFNITNLHSKPFAKYPQYSYNKSGKVKRSGSVERPVYGWVWGMKDMQHYNAVWMRASTSDDILYGNTEVEYCIVTINDTDTTYHVGWRKCHFENSANSDESYAMWIQHENNTAWIGGGWNYDIPWSTVYNVPLFGTLTGLYLGSASKVLIDDVFITVKDKDTPRLTDWTQESLISYFGSNRELDPIEGFWHFAEDNKYLDKTLLGGKYELAIVANGNRFDIIYLSGAQIYPGKWREGTLKGSIQRISSRYYEGYWYDAEGEKLEKVFFYSILQKLNVEFVTEKTVLSLLPSKHYIDNISSTSQGTGFAISEEGYIVTNHHVIDDCNEFYIHFDPSLGMQPYSAELVVCDSIHDLAILRINDPEFKSFDEIPYSISHGEVRSGEDIFYLGYPQAGVIGNNIKYSMGNITAVNSYKRHEFMMSVDIDHGSSGSPVFNTAGDVVGIAYSGYGTDVTRITANFAIKSQYLHRLIEQLPTPITLPTNKIKELSQPDKIEAITPYVFLIEALKH